MQETTKHPLFLKWVLLNSLIAVVLIAASVASVHLITSLESRLSAIIVIAAFAAASGYAGKLAWRSDLIQHTYQRDDVLTDLAHTEFAADKLPWLGLIGTMVGVLLLFLAAKASGDPHALAKHVTEGLATVFVPSILGAVGSVVLDAERHMIEHEIA